MLVGEPAQVSANPEIVSKENDRQALKHALICLSTSDFIDTDDEITDFNDMFHEKRRGGWDTTANKHEILPVGFVRDNDNGTISCETALKKAADIMGYGNGENDVLEALTDGERTNFSEAIPGSVVSTGVTAFRSDVEAKIDEIVAEITDSELGAAVIRFSIQERLAAKNLIDICYSTEPVSEASRTPGGQDFELTVPTNSGEDIDVIFFYKGDGEVRDRITTDTDGGWYDDDGVLGDPTRIGHITVTQSLDDLHADTDGFYPLGRDLARSDKTQGANNDPWAKGLIDCEFIKENEDDLFGREESGFVFNPDTNSFSLVNLDGGTEEPVEGPGEPGAEEPPNNCEANNQDAFAWLFCGILDSLDTAVLAIFDIAENFLDIRAQDIRDNQELETTWSYFRSLASFMLLAIGLAMVISQALSGGR